MKSVKRSFGILTILFLLSFFIGNSHAQGLDNKVLSDFTQAIKLSPKFTEAYNMRVLVYEAKSEKDKAKKDREEIIIAKGDPKRNIKRILDSIDRVCKHSEDFEAAGWLAAQALNELAKIGKPAVPQLLEFAQDKKKDNKARCFIIDVLSGIKDERSVEPLISILQDSSEETYIREVAANALGGLADSKDVTATTALIAIVSTSDIDIDIQRRAAISLGNLKVKEAAKPLISILQDEKKREIWDPVAGALGKIGNSQVVEPLITAFEKGASTAAYSLAKIGGDRAIEYLVKKCNTELDIDVVKALGYTKDQRVIPALINALGNEDEGIAERAAEALAKIGDSRIEVIEALEEALGRVKDLWVKQRISNYLKELTGNN